MVNLFRCVKHHAPELQRILQYELNARESFKEYIYYNNNHLLLTDIQRAANFYMLIKSSYGCDLKSYGSKVRNINSSLDYLTKIQERLGTVLIESADFETLIKKYDKQDTLFYLDPPYFETEKYYNVVFTKDDHRRLKQCLDQIKCKFVLSYNDCDYIRDLYADYIIEEIERNSNLTNRYANKDKKYAELIIRNYQ